MRNQSSLICMANDVRFVFLDRDGVINVKAPEGSYVRNWKDLQLLPDAAESVAMLNRSGLKVIVVTNQRGIALGLLSELDLQGVHERLADMLANAGAHVDAIFYCPHDKNVCNCRKPKPGLFLQAFERFPAANATNSVMIGDSASDMMAGNLLGMRTVLVRQKGRSASGHLVGAEELADWITDSLQGAVERLLFGEPFQKKASRTDK